MIVFYIIMQSGSLGNVYLYFPNRYKHYLQTRNIMSSNAVALLTLLKVSNHF